MANDQIGPPSLFRRAVATTAVTATLVSSGVTFLVNKLTPTDAIRNEVVLQVKSSSGTGLNMTGSGNLVMSGSLTIQRTTDAGWAVKAGADTACNTTCTHACVFGVNTAATEADIVACTDTTADECLCAGPT